jgi:phosphopantothenoylcysteine synthetase/decarboxylase
MEERPNITLSENDKVEEMDRLNKEYMELSNSETKILQELRQLEQDEILLRNALKDMSETAREKLDRQRREREEDIVKNLQAALMGNDSSSSDDDDMDDLLDPKTHATI